MADAPAAAGTKTLDELQVPQEIRDYAKTMWMIHIIGWGPLYLIFVNKPEAWKNPWFVTQVRAMLRTMVGFILCTLPGMYMAFLGFSAVGGGKDPKIPFAAPNGSEL